MTDLWSNRTPLSILMDRFKLRATAIEGELIGDCPVAHEGNLQAVFTARSFENGWAVGFCDMGCSPREVYEGAAQIDEREPGEDDDKPTPKGLEQYAIPSSIELLRQEPPKREYLLSVASTGNGVLARGQVGLIAARGGTGKSNALMQLGVAVATGTTWMGSGLGWAAKQGRALMLFAEEDADEVKRRLYYAIKAAGLISDEDLALITKNLVLMPMRGLGVALSSSMDQGVLPITERAGQIQTYLRSEATASRPFALVGLDPLVRFAGADVETDNNAATRFVEICETFTATECGQPNVVLAHHSRKLIAKDADQESVDIIRGASGLVDAVRWAAIMVRKKGSLLTKLKVVKTNYAAEPEPLTLAKAEGCHGALEAVNADVEDVGVVHEVDFELQRKVYDEIVKEPSSGSEIARRLNARLEDVLKVCSDLGRSTRIVRKGQRWIASAASQSLPGKC